MRELILGIETSCDDTAVAIVDSAGHVLSSMIASQLAIHNSFGGVYPEYAAREHVAAIIPTIDACFAQSGVKPNDIIAIGVTRGPGLVGSIIVGLNTAKGLGLGWNKMVVGINHLRGHLRSADLEVQRVKYPAIILLVSGGHTFLAYLKSNIDIKILGMTRDDSVGESYDKVARMLGLGYPGGPIVDRLSATGLPVIDFPRPLLLNGYDFSFSGLKSSVSRYINNCDNPHLENISASFVSAVIDVLLTKSKKAIIEYGACSFIIVGGVAASPPLRRAASELCTELNVELCLPPVKWSTDNGAMIALATFDYLKYNKYLPANPELNLKITDF